MEPLDYERPEPATQLSMKVVLGCGVVMAALLLLIVVGVIGPYFLEIPIGPSTDPADPAPAATRATTNDGAK